MEKLKNEVVKDVTTKKKYVRPEFQVVEMKFEAQLLADSAQAGGSGSGRYRTISNGWNS